MLSVSSISYGNVLPSIQKQKEDVFYDEEKKVAGIYKFIEEPTSPDIGIIISSFNDLKEISLKIKVLSENSSDDKTILIYGFSFIDTKTKTKKQNVVITINTKTGEIKPEDNVNKTVLLEIISGILETELMPVNAEIDPKDKSILIQIKDVLIKASQRPK